MLDSQPGDELNAGNYFADKILVVGEKQVRSGARRTGRSGSRLQKIRLASL